MNEFKYYDIPSPFPTLARGLFTIEVPESEYGVKHRIVARGYDKFFNIGEVPWTTVREISHYPYISTKYNTSGRLLRQILPLRMHFLSSRTDASFS